MSNDAEKIIYSMIRVSKRHGQREVLKDISLSYFYGAKIGTERRGQVFFAENSCRSGSGL